MHDDDDDDDDDCDTNDVCGCVSVCLGVVYVVRVVCGV